MAIPEKQLETWANVGAEKAAESTYASIKAATDAAKSTALKEFSYDVYLQGSYRNSTSIYGDMDVDVVVEATDFFYKDVDDLTESQKAEFERQFPGSPSHSFNDFRSAVERTLTDYYGSSLITLRNKCIQVTGKSGRLDADVVPCVRYRDFRKDESARLPTPKEGITFWTRNAARQVINYPRQHYDNGVVMNKNTSYRFKPTVRIFKNLRNHCSANNLIADGVAPSYFVSCLIYNAPTDLFKPRHEDTVVAVLKWMNGLTDEQWGKLVAQCGLLWLCRDKPDYWPIANAKAFKTAAIKAWNDWGK
ncbi:MAG TPA: nucleotidyltransferase [Candidatus Baltobacteraceae bacterium]|jgi:hypothetical protein